MMHYYPHNIADYRKDTSHLSLLEHGCYHQLLDQYYLNEEPLPLDDKKIFRLLNARTENEQIAIRLVLEDFFTKTENGYVHSRCEIEIEQYHLRSDSASKAGKASGLSRKLNGRSNSVQLTSNQEPVTKNQELKDICINKYIDQNELDFDIFWHAYPRKVGKEAAKKAWNKTKPNISVVLEALGWQINSDQWFKNGGQFVPNPATYLNQHRFLDERPVRLTF